MEVRLVLRKDLLLDKQTSQHYGIIFAPKKLSSKLTETEIVLQFLYYWPLAKVFKWPKVRRNRGLIGCNWNF
jgi:hypothetical protein